MERFWHRIQICKYCFSRMSVIVEKRNLWSSWTMTKNNSMAGSGIILDLVSNAHASKLQNGNWPITGLYFWLRYNNVSYWTCWSICWIVYSRKHDIWPLRCAYCFEMFQTSSSSQNDYFLQNQRPRHYSIKEWHLRIRSVQKSSWWCFRKKLTNMTLFCDKFKIYKLQRRPR